jgi:5'-nucleotidase
VRTLLFEEPGFLVNCDLIPRDGVLNINIPALPFDEIKGMRITRLGVRNYTGVMQRREDPRGNDYFWMGGEPVPLDSDELDVDMVAVDQGYISITPLKFDTTFHEIIPDLQRKIIKE